MTDPARHPVTGFLYADDVQHKGGSLEDGEIRRVDKEAGLLTIKHGPIPSLRMPAMTMAFRVKNHAMLDRFQAGDKVKFQAEKIGGQYLGECSKV